MLAVALAAALGTAIVLTHSQPASAAVVRPFALNYDQDVYGDFLESGNGNMRCPNPTDPVDPAANPQPIANCAPTQARTQTANNDNFYMRWADVDSNANTFNSSSASLELPPGSTVDYARLNWSGDTGVYKDANGNQLSTAACGSRQLFQGIGASPTPPGSAASTPAQVSVNGTTTAVNSIQTTVDPLAGLPNNSPQYYTSYADITSLFNGAPTGTAIPLTVGNVWTPEGFGCYAGWSMVVVYKYAAANTTYAPLKRSVQIYDGHVRQANGQAATNVQVDGLRVATSDVRVGLTAYEGDYGIPGDQFLINNQPTPEPLSTTNDTTNFFVSNAQNATNPKVANNFSVDAKEFITNRIPTGSTSATLSFVTSGDSYLAENLAVSSPVPTIRISKVPNATVVRAGSPISFSITVTNPTESPLHDVAVNDPQYPTCNRTVATLAGGDSDTATCTVTAAGDDFSNSASTTGQDDFGGTVTDGPSSSGSVRVINPAITISKTADKAVYNAGDTITYTILVRNTGDAPLTDVTVYDANLAGCERAVGALAAGGSSTYTCTATAPIRGGSNTARVTGTDETGGTVSSSSTAPSPTSGSIAGRVFADRNNDGIANGSDTGISGVTVNLTGTTTGGAAVNLTTTSGPDGSYSFTAVPPGTYTTTELQPAGFTDGTDTPGTNAVANGNDSVTVTLPDAGTSTGTLFAEIPTGSLSGAVYVDGNNDGTRQAGENGIGGVAVTLSGTDNDNHTISITTTSAADGSYTFPALRAGTYSVVESQPNAYVDGKDAAGSAGGAVTAPDSITGVTLTTGQQATGYLFGELQQAVISGSVLANGQGLPGVTVTLTGTDDRGNPVTVAGTTKADGSYVFAGLRPGTYTVTETQPAGYGNGDASPGGNGGTANGPNVIAGITVAAGNQVDNNVFTDTTGSLSGTVYEDANDDGIQQTGEAGIAGVTVTVTGTDAAGNAITTQAQADPDGHYTVTGLLSGTYRVTETQPSSYLDGKDTVGNAGGVLTPPDSISQVALGAGQNAIAYNFGEIKPASVVGKVTTTDGKPIPGVTLTLTGTDDRGNAVSVTTTTNSDGSFGLNNPRPSGPGGYTVTETQPAAYGQGTATAGNAGGTPNGTDVITGITLVAGQSGTGYVFTEAGGSIAGTVYEDVDDDGTFNTGDQGIAGVTITVTGTDVNNNPVTATVQSGASGAWTVTGLPAGSYTVKETQPTGYLTRTDTPGTGGGTVTAPDTISPVTVTAGAQVTGYQFGEVRTGSIAGTVRDTNNNPIAGVTVTLTGTDSGGNPVSVTTQTGPDGKYTFTDVNPGTYTVTETQPAGYGAGSATAGNRGGTVADPNTVTTIRMGSNSTATGYDFLDSLGSIAGAVYDDANGNGQRDVGEDGIAGVTVTVNGTDAAGNPVTVATQTQANGAWSIPNLLGGTYTVTETQPAGYLDGADAAGTAGGTHAGADTFTGVALGDGQNATGYLFGETRPAGLSGAVRDDKGRPIEGVTVTLTGTDAYGNPINLTTTTGTDGSYSLTNLPPSGPGGYTVTETQPDGYGPGSASTGTGAGGSVNGPNQITGVTVGSGTTGAGYDFTDTTSSLSGTVYGDTNRNGTLDNGEPGIGGVTITVTGTDAGGKAVSVTTTTAADGTWTVAALRGGTYSVTETQPAGYADGQDSPGSAGGATSGTDTIGAIALPGGETATGYDFGELAGSLSGAVYVDANNNGQQDTGEVPIAGVTVTVTGRTAGGTTITRTTVSRADGSYTVTDLPTGTYTVTETQPANYADGKDTPGNAGGTAQSPDSITGVSLTAGQQGTGYLFGERLGVISGTVFLDANRDGTLGAGEPVRLGGVTVQLKNAAGTVVATTTTAADGTFSFADLTPGQYTVVELQPDGYGSSTPNTVAVTLTQASGNDVRFGETLGRIGDRVFADTNRNGLQDAGEKGVGNVKVTLYDSAGTAVATTTTAADGSYHFDVKAGSYTVGVTLPTGQTFTQKGAGSDGAKDSDFAQSTGRSGTVTVSVGSDGTISQNNDIDAGLVPIIHDLQVTITPDQPTVKPGDPIGYTVTVTNQGTVPEKGAVTTVTLPPGSTLTGAQGDGWVCTTKGNVATCTYPGTIEPGQSAPPLKVTGTAPDAPGNVPATAVVTTAAGQSRHSDVATVTVSATAPSRPGSGNGGLAFTGVQVIGMLGAALILVAGGVLLLVSGRRRRRS